MNNYYQGIGLIAGWHFTTKNFKSCTELYEFFKGYYDREDRELPKGDKFFDLTYVKFPNRTILSAEHIEMEINENEYSLKVATERETYKHKLLYDENGEVLGLSKVQPLLHNDDWHVIERPKNDKS